MSKKSFLIGTFVSKNRVLLPPSIFFNAHKTLKCSIYSFTNKLFLARSWFWSPGPTQKMAKCHHFSSPVFSTTSREAEEFFGPFSLSSLKLDHNSQILGSMLTWQPSPRGWHRESGGSFKQNYIPGKWVFINSGSGIEIACALRSGNSENLFCRTE